MTTVKGKAKAFPFCMNTPQIDRQARWDAHFMDDAVWASRKSKDRSRKVGCVIVNERNTDIARGWNGFPRGVDDNVEERHDRPFKYSWTEHAERNAIYNAAAEGIRLKGSTLYSTLMPCCDCARAIIQSGIVRLVTPEPDWADTRSVETFHFDIARDMLVEAGVVIDYADAPDIGLNR